MIVELEGTQGGELRQTSETHNTPLEHPLSLKMTAERAQEVFAALKEYFLQTTHRDGKKHRNWRPEEQDLLGWTIKSYAEKTCVGPERFVMDPE